MFPTEPPQGGPKKPFNPAKADAAAKAILAQGGSQHDVDTYLSQAFGLAPAASAVSGPHDIHAEYRSGALGKRMAGANARDAANLKDEQALPPGPRAAAGGFLANLIRDIPGGEALTSGVHALVNRQPYREAYNDVHGAEENLPGLAKWPARLAGAAVGAAALPGSAVAKGALYGGALGATDADPDADRVQGGVLGALLGGAVGKVASGKFPGAQRLGKLTGASRIADKVGEAKSAFRLRSLGKMDIAPETSPASPQPPRLPPRPLTKASVSAEQNALRREGVSAMDVLPETTPPTPQPPRLPAASQNWDQRLNSRLNQWGSESHAPQQRVGPAEPTPQSHAPATPTGRPGHPIWQGAQPKAPTFDQRLQQLITLARQQAPLGEEAGNVVGDAELAMKPHATDDLEGLLRQSLAKPRLVRP